MCLYIRIQVRVHIAGLGLGFLVFHDTQRFRASHRTLKNQAGAYQ